MTEIERKALALVKRLRIIPDQNGLMCEDYEDVKQAADLIEQHEAFKQEVSGVMTYIKALYPTLPRNFNRFIITKPDPLVEVVKEVTWYDYEITARQLRTALEARGLEIREKNDDR